MIYFLLLLLHFINEMRFKKGVLQWVESHWSEERLWRWRFCCELWTPCLGVWNSIGESENNSGLPSPSSKPFKGKLGRSWDRKLKSEYYFKLMGLKASLLHQHTCSFIWYLNSENFLWLSREKEEQLRRVTEVQRLQAQQAGTALEEFKRQVELNSEKDSAEMKQRVRRSQCQPFWNSGAVG